MKIEYSNMPRGASKFNFFLRYMFNIARTWYCFNIKYPWVKYDGFVRVLGNTSFSKGMSISIGNNVQFGNYCNISTDIIFGNNILMAGRVCFIGKHDHQFIESQQLIWSSIRGDNGITIISDDVWIGHNATIVGGVTIGRGSIIAAGAVVTSSIPECEIWGGVPARKIKNRFNTRNETEKHLVFLDSIKKQQFK